MSEKENKEILWRERKRNAIGLPWTFTVYSFTAERLFVESGLFTAVEDEVRLYRVLDLSLSRTLWQKLFKMGTIKVDSADKSLGNFELKNIRRPKEVKEQLSELVEACRDKKRVTNREFMSDVDDLDEDNDTY